MKLLGGGHLYREAPKGLDVDVAIASGREIPSEIMRNLAGEKRLVIEMWCAKCGACIETCTHGALTMGEERAVVDPEKCVFYGYFAAHCREFCIKVV